MSAISGPNGPSGAAEQFKQFSDQLTTILKKIPGVTPEEVKEISHETLEMPPEERFTQSLGVLEERMVSELEGSDLDIDTDFLEQSLPILLNKLTDDLDSKEDQSLAFAVENREGARLSLVISLYFEALSELLQLLYEQSLSDDLDEPLPSVALALNSRLMDFQEENFEILAKDLIEDVVYANYYLAQATDRPTPTHPSELSDRRMQKQVLTIGATKAYRELDISLSRGAELAGMSLDEFEAALSQQGIQPRQGPDADDELYDDSEDWF